MVDDPYAFGQIAAANALSDIYAMGGTPLTAMNITAFPKCENLEILGEILLGGADKVKEAEALLIGGHTIDDTEPKYGLAVTGIARPEEILPNSNGQAGDILVLTKSLGNGILATAVKADLAEQNLIDRMIAEMAFLNKDAAVSMKEAKAHCATDITGFGFLGHLGEVTAASRVAAQIWADQIPVWPEAVEFAKMGLIPAGSYTNQDHMKERVKFDADVPVFMRDLMFDPQTSGGLLIAVPEKRLKILTEALEARGVGYAVVGMLLPGVTKEDDVGKIYIKGNGKWS